ncbi:hypothetical protein HF888_00610 [Bermanella marisrubri]|nr:hypothetical protein [Bermanella marisrubri]QIZ82827.1 hypothetical protein HF888_00610 [Bermanella marisrubri]
MFKKRPGKSYLPSLLKSSVYAALLSTSICSYAADGRSDYDLDDDGLIEINDISDLIAIPRYTSGISLYGSSAGCPAAGCFGFELTKDLDFDTNQDGVINYKDTNDDYWTPISLRDATFEGNGHVILNLRVFNFDSYSGLFGYVQNSIIRNIGLSGPLMYVRGGFRSGSLVATANNTHIENVFNTGSVRARVTDGQIEGELGYAGGLVGELSNGSSLINAFNSGPVYGAYPGGLVGHSATRADLEQSIIRNGLNIGKLSLDRSVDGYAGGILASHGPYYVEDLKVENSYWATDASGEMDSYGSGRPDARTTKSYFGLSLEDLKCAEQANISGANRCFYLGSTPILFKDWDKAQFDGQPFWDFGSDIQIAAPNMHGNAYRDTDNDTVPDFKDDFPFNIAVSKDSDKDGYPDNWNSNCDVTCREESGLILDQFPNVDAAWQDEDLDSLPDSWAQGCDTSCKNNSGLTLDSSLNDTDNDGIKNHVDNDDSGNGSIDIDANSNGLVDIYNLEQLNAIRYQLDGNGLRMENRGSLDQSGCPLVTYESVLMRRCHGYELLTDLDFDTSQDGVLGIGDDFWNDGKGWIAIGGRSHPFTGTFEGNGYTIHNLLINQSTDYQALFATAENAVIRNLRLSGSLMSVQGANYVGSLVGYSKLSRIENVFNTGAVQGSQIIGGIVGYLRDSHMENVLNTGSITGDNRVGGLVGYSSGAYQYENTPLRISIINGLNTGFVTGYDGVNAGGLVGVVDSSSIIENSYWAEDASGLSISSRESEDRSYVGLSLAVLQCAIQANTHSGNSNCVSSDGSAEGLTSGVTLFKNWNQAMLNGLKLWDFGNSSQLPAMVFRGEVYRDSDGDFIVDGQDAYPYIPLEGRPDTDNDGIPNECDQACLVTGMSEDIDDDNDGVLDVQDAYPLVAIGDLTDTDNDGAPDSCDATCIELGMAADRDDDNDGVLDAQDAYPLIAIGDLTDTDSDGAPDSCDEDCLALGMTADLDNDNDGVADVNDVYPLIALGERLDTDNDGIPNECDSACEALGMLADIDDDNDGVADANDAYPLIALGERLDTDSDGIPNECDTACEELGMLADTDNDNDGVEDANDAYPLISLGERLDTDNDGIPNQCNETCVALGMTADTDDDNDGVLDANDAYPLIALGERLDTDSDGIPNECDTACEELGMLADTDNDNDGVEDANDAYPLISLGERLDTDNDGIPNQCNETCVALGMTADTDDDNDGVLDANDAYPLIALGERLDTDNDGAPDTCDEACTTLGMAADTDDDNDGVADANDAYPLISLGGRLDSDNDGIPNQCDTACEELGMLADTDDDNDGVLDVNDVFPLDRTEHSDFDNDGLGDVADTDDDNDGVDDINDPNLGADNGAPEIVFVPTIPPVAVTTENGDAFELLVDETFLNHFQTVDAVDTVFTYEGSLDGEVLAIDENNIMLIPAGHQAIQLVAIDTSGNRSEPYELVVNVYPRIRFEQSTSITGEHSTTNIKVQLTGDSPEYPVVVNFNVSQLSDVDQNDLDDSFDIEAQHQVIIEAGEAEALNRDGFIEILIIEDNESENDELLVVDLLSAQLASESEGEIESLFAIDETNQQHELTVTYQNLAPTVQLKLEQDGVEVANVTQGGGQVSITALIQDGNGMDTHTITWDLNDIGLNAPLGEMLSFNPDNIPAGSYSISVEVVDSGIGNLTDTATIEFNIVEPVVQPDNREGESSSGGGSLPLWFILLMFMSLLTRQQANRQKTYVK